MANLGNLNFEIIIDDKKFNKQVDDAIKKAKNLNVSLSQLLNARQQYAKAASAAAAAEKQWKQALQDSTSVVGKHNKAISSGLADMRKYVNLKNQMGTSGSVGGLSRQAGLMSQLTSLATRYVSIWGAVSFVKNVAQISGEFELQKRTLQSIIGNMEMANEVYYKIWDLALKSPFNAKELVSYAKQLSAYSIPVNELYDTTKMLADMSAGLGVGMDRLVLAYGQIRSASFLRGQEVRQLTEAGVPILEELRKQFEELGEMGITAGDVFDKISKRMVPFEMVEKVFKNMTEEGGKFYKMQEKQAETLKGKIMILKDAFDKMFNAIGENNNSTLKNIVDTITDMTRNYEKWGTLLKGLIVTYGSYKAALAAVNVYHKAALAIDLVKYYSALSTKAKALGVQINTLAVAWKKMTEAQKAAAIGGIVGVFAAIGVAIAGVIKQANELDKALKKTVSEQELNADNLVNGYKDLVDALSKAEQGSQNYRDAISKLNNKYEEYLPHLYSEKMTLDEIKASEDAVTNAIYARAKAYAWEEGQRKIEDKYGIKITDRVKDLVETLQNENVSADVARNFVARVRDTLERYAANGQLTTDTYVNVWRSIGESFFGYEEWHELDLWSASIDNKLHSLQSGIDALSSKKRQLSEDIANSFAESQYQTKAELEAIQEIVDEYGRLEVEIRNTKGLTDSEVTAKVKQNEIDKLDAMIKKYEELDKAAGLGTYKREIESLREQMNQLTGVADNMFQKLVKAVPGASEQSLIPDSNEDQSEYAKRLKKEYEEVTKRVDQTNNSIKALTSKSAALTDIEKTNLESWEEGLAIDKERKKVIEAISKETGIQLSDTEKATNNNDDAKRKIQDEIARIKELMSWYQKFKELGLGDDSVSSILARLFPDDADLARSREFNAALEEQINLLEKYDKSAAQSARLDVNKSAAEVEYDKQKDRINKTRKLLETIQKMNTEFSLGGKGVQFDISKAIKKYKDAVAKFQQEARNTWKQYTDTYAAGGDVPFAPDDFLNRLNARYNGQQGNAYAELIDAIDSYAEAWVKDWAKIKGIDLERWGDMSLGELRRVKEALSQLLDENGNIADPQVVAQLKAQFGEIEGAYEQFANSIEEVIKGKQENGAAGGLLGKLFPRMTKKQAKEIEYVADSILSLADSVKELADATGNEKMSEAAEGVNKLTNVIQGAGEGFRATGSWIGAVAGGVVAFAKNIINETTEARKALNEFEQSLTDARLTSEMNRLRRELEGDTSVFGDNLYASIGNASKVIDESKGKLGELAEQVKKTYSEWDRTSYQFGISFSGADVVGAEDIYIPEISMSIRKAAKSLKADLYDEFGNVNAETIDLILNTYGDKMDSSTKNLIEKMKIQWQAIQDADAQVRSAMESLVGGVADSLTDKIVDNWLRAGDAALDYADILSEVAQSYAKMMVKEALLTNIFDDDFQKQIAEYTKVRDVDSALLLIDERMQEVADYMPYLEQMLSGLSKYVDTTTETASTASGIQGVTEDTANLLASYINGMRADLAAQRIAVEGIGVDVKTIVTSSLPDINTHLANIEAYTLNTANNTAQLMSDIASVLSNDGGRTAIRTLSI